MGARDPIGACSAGGSPLLADWKIIAFGKRLPALAVVGTTMILLIVVLFVAARTVTFASFSRFEYDSVVQDMKRVSNTYDATLDSLATIADDWSQWDDTYYFIAYQNPEYVEVNLATGSLENVKVDLMAFYSLDGRLLYSSYADGATDATGTVASTLKSIEGDVRVVPDADVEPASCGLIRCGDDYLMYGIAAVTTSLQDQPPNGTLLVGRFLDADVVDEISETTGLPLSLIPAEDLAASERTDGAPLVTTHAGGGIYGTIVLDDWNGAPVVALRADLPRAIMREGSRAMTTFGVALGLIGLTASAVLLYAVRREADVLGAQLNAEREARVAQTRHWALVDSMADAVFGIDEDGRVFFANPRAAKLTGKPIKDLVRMHYRDLLTADSAEHVAEIIEGEHGGITTIEATILDADGGQIPVEIGVSWYYEAQDGASRMQWVARDVAERKRFESELVHLATHDHLTGLFNRRRFEEEIEGRLARSRRDNTAAAVLWLDLDNFKEINDSLGHKIGDDILASLAVELNRRMRGDTVLARLGGDEFGMLMPEVERDEIEALGNRILEEIRATEFGTPEGTVRVTPSIGVVLLPDHATSPEEALTRADLAMYRAKEDGRNRVCLYRPDEGWHQELRSRFDWGLAIETALREDRLEVHWQPIIDLGTGEVDRYELLVRMRAEDGTLVPPGSFLPAAERLGLISEIDSYMVRWAVALLATMPEGGVRVDVNLSGKALSSSDVSELLARELKRTGVNPARLGIEITETVAVVDMIKARSFIEGLKAIGVRVALDDFGSGFSSFYYLRNLPIDALKIDGTFVREIVENHRDQHVVRSIVELARGLGIDTTAECVEDQATLDLLKSFGITHAQGFHIARPGPVEG